MAQEFKGDIRVARVIEVGRRLDEGLKVWGALTGNINLTSTSYAWHTADPNGLDRDVIFPDATTLKVGWQTTIQNDGTVNNLLIKDNTGVLLETIEPKSAVRVTLYGNGAVDGEWYIEDLNEQITSEERYVLTCGYANNSNTGRWLEFQRGNSSFDLPFIVETSSQIVGLTIVSRSISTGTVTIYKNGISLTTISLTTISLTAQKKNISGVLAIPLVASDEISAQVTAGSFDRVHVYIHCKKV